MNYSASRGFAASAQTVVSQDRRSPFAVATATQPGEKIHNARGLVLAVMMSAACWAGIGLALLL